MASTIGADAPGASPRALAGLRPEPLAQQRYPAPRLTRFDTAWRYAVAVVGAASSVLVMLLMLGSGRPTTAHTIAVVLSAVVAVLSIWLMRYRRRWPVPIAMIAAALSIASGSAGVASDWALVSLATRRRTREVVLVGAWFVACRAAALLNPLWWLGLRTPGMSVPVVHLVNLAGSLVEVALMVVIGFYVGARRDLIASLREQVQTTERQQELLVLHAEAQERNRIAREMHDVVAHRISLVAMHAGALAFRSDLSPEQTHDIAQTIQENAAASLTELRSVLGQLRTTTELAAPLPPDKPQPTLIDIRELVLDARSAGMVVDFDDQVERPDLLPGQTGRHAYRIVQEALTNVRKHASGARVLVQLGGGPGRGLDLLVQNALRPGVASLPGSGAGLVGMHERAQMVGGQLTAGVQNGFFDVKVWFPW